MANGGHGGSLLTFIVVFAVGVIIGYTLGKSHAAIQFPAVQIPGGK